MKLIKLKKDEDNNLTYYEALNELFNYHCECLQKLWAGNYKINGDEENEYKSNL